MEVVWMALMVIPVNVLLTMLAVTVTTQTTVQSIVLTNLMGVKMEFAVLTMEPVLIQMSHTTVAVYHHGYLTLIVEEKLYHVIIILVKIMEHVNLMVMVTFAIVV